MQRSLLLLPSLGALLMPAGSAAAAPATLVEISGAHVAPARLSESVVLIIDAQREYVDGALPLAGVRAAMQETARLLARARAAGIPVIHIQQQSPADRRIFVAGTPLADFTAEAKPAAGEAVIPKKLPNSFAGTTLDETLHRLGRKQIIVAGCMTHMCVSTTVRSAVDHGYRCTIVGSACATRDLRAADGGTVPAEVVHRVALAELADRFASVVDRVDDLID